MALTQKAREIFSFHCRMLGLYPEHYVWDTPGTHRGDQAEETVAVYDTPDPDDGRFIMRLVWARSDADCVRVESCIGLDQDSQLKIVQCDVDAIIKAADRAYQKWLNGGMG